MKKGTFQFYVSPRYVYSSYRVKEPIWAVVRYDYSEITKTPKVTGVEFKFSVIHAININENLKNEILEAAKNNAKSMFEQEPGIPLENAYFTSK